MKYPYTNTTHVLSLLIKHSLVLVIISVRRGYQGEGNISEKGLSRRIISVKRGI